MIVEKSELEGEAVIEVLKLNRRNGKMTRSDPHLLVEVPMRDVFCKVADQETVDFVNFNLPGNEFDMLKAAYRTFKTKK